MFDESKPASFPDNMKESGPGSGFFLNAEEVQELVANGKVILKDKVVLLGTEIGEEVQVKGPDYDELAKITSITPTTADAADVTVELVKR